MKLLLILTCSVSTVLGLSCNPDSNVKTSTIDPADSAMVSSAYQRVLFIIKASEEAQTRSTSSQTKEVAAKILSDNARLKTEFEELSGRKVFQLPLDINDGQLKTWRLLVAKKGWEFDRKFLEFVRASSESVQDSLENLRAKSEDPDVKNIAFKFQKTGDDTKNLATDILHRIEQRIKGDSINQAVTLNK